MNKKEIYYKFIFPKYSELSGKDTDPLLITASDYSGINDGNGQTGEVRNLCRKCPERVITYDQLDTTNTLLPMYSDKWTTAKRDEIRGYVDQWIAKPKYFNLRNYWDANLCQEGGMSLMVSHSPEVGSTSTTWTKFTASNSKVVYCSLIVSSGDFFHEFTLPDEVIKKSGLRDEVVSSQFHSNWYLTSSTEKVYYWHYYSSAIGLTRNPNINAEKRVFVPHYCLEGTVIPRNKKVVTYNHGFKSKIVSLHTDSSDSFYTNQNHPAYKDHNNEDYTDGVFPYTDDEFTIDPSTGNRIPSNAKTAQEKIDTAVAEDVRRLQFQDSYVFTTWPQSLAYRPGDRPTVVGDRIALPYNIETGSATTYNSIKEDLKRDFIDLEVTRRILYYNDGVRLLYNGTSRDIHPTSDIPRVLSGAGYSTVLSFEPPDEYIDAEYTYNGDQVRGTPPLQIPYNYLRYALNDRPPFTDCETVLVMWVADKDPMSSDIISVADLHNQCNFQQYAIPISVRCCFKDPVDNEKYCNNRFLVSYPRRRDPASNPEPPNGSLYRYHIRRGVAYDSSKFIDREVLFLQDLLECSGDYIISYQNKAYNKGGFDIQLYLFKHYLSAFKELYVKKAPASISDNQQQQIYYIKVDKKDANNHNTYGIDTSTETVNHNKICIVKVDSNGNNTSDPFVPSEVLTQSKYSEFDFNGNNDWDIRNYDFIALFDTKCNGVNICNEIPGVITLTNDSYSSSINGGKTLREFLQNTISSSYTWNDIYISSLGVSPTNQIENESLWNGVAGSTYLSIGALDNYIKIGNTRYGSKINNKVIIGFNKMFDYKYDDIYHFRYNSATNKYDSVSVKYDYTADYTTDSRFIITYPSFSCIAYVIDVSSE